MLRCLSAARRGCATVSSRPARKLSTRALTAIAAQLPALILLDVTMPDDRTTLLEKLCSQSRAWVPIFIMSAAPRIDESMRAQGAADFLVKPFDLDDLLACVARYVPGPQPLAQ
jgi:DNA-binding response OmpR family regulator